MPTSTTYMPPIASPRRAPAQSCVVFDFPLLENETALHQGRGVYVHRGGGGESLPLSELQRATLFISPIRVVLVLDAPEAHSPRRVYSIPLHHLDDEELITEGARPYLRFTSTAPTAAGVFEVHCAIPDRKAAIQGMICTYFVLLGRLFEARFAPSLETLDAPRGPADARPLAPSPPPAPRPDEPPSPREKAAPPARAPSPRLPPIASAAGRPRSPAGRPGAGCGDAVYCLRTPCVDAASGELRVALRPFERRRAALLDPATGAIYLAQEARPAALPAAPPAALAAERLARGVGQLAALSALHASLELQAAA